MRYVLTLIGLCLALKSLAQQTPLPHGMVFGNRPDTGIVVSASKLEAFMDKKNRINTVIKGRVSTITRQQGGWFELDAGEGKVIVARFKDYNINLPTALKGRTVVIQGVANRKLTAINGQPSGNAQAKATNAAVVKNAKVKIIFEVTGLMVYQ